MKKNYEVEGHRFTIEFVNNSLIHRIKIKSLFSQKTYEAKNVELVRMKMDTIMAALEKRDTKSITCIFLLI